jgi:hypothetical protein
MNKTLTALAYCLLLLSGVALSDNMEADQSALEARLHSAGVEFDFVRFDDDGSIILSMSGSASTNISVLTGMHLSYLDLSYSQVTDLSALTNAPLRDLRISGTAITNLEPLAGMPIHSLHLDRTQVCDLSPLSGMPLRYLDLTACKNVHDLSPLKGAPLSNLNLEDTSVRDLSPLRTMPLRILDLDMTPVRDISALKGLKVTLLGLRGTQVIDLSPLAGTPIENLDLEATQVTDLSPLSETPIGYLWLTDNTCVSDLSPLSGLELQQLSILRCTNVTDVSALEGMHLDYASFSPHHIREGIKVLRQMQSLKHIRYSGYEFWPSEVFWKMYDEHTLDTPTKADVSAMWAKVRYSGGDGRTVDSPIAILGAGTSDVGIKAEEKWLQQHFPGYVLQKQSLMEQNKRKVDAMEITIGADEYRTVYFDITDFFGK